MIATSVMNESNCVSTAKLYEIRISLFKKISILCNLIVYLFRIYGHDKFVQNINLPEVIKKDTLTQVFSCEFCEIFKNTFFIEHLRAITSVLCKLDKYTRDFSPQLDLALHQRQKVTNFAAFGRLFIYCSMFYH